MNEKTEFSRALDEYGRACYSTQFRRVKAEARAAVEAMYEELSKAVKYEQHRAGRIGTHSPNCWTWGPQHYECAMRHVEALRADAESMDAIGKIYDEAPGLPLDNAPPEALEKWTDALVSIGLHLGIRGRK